MNTIKVGGQALDDGVMMESRHYCSVARWVDEPGSPDKKLVVESVEQNSVFNRMPWLAYIPIIRGFVSLFDRFFTDNTDRKRIMAEDEEDEAKSSWPVRICSIVVIATLVFLALYLIPHMLANMITSERSWMLVFRGLFQMCIFMGFFKFMHSGQEANEMLQFHAAEHQAILAYLKNGVIDDSASNTTRFAFRCGTTYITWYFILLMIIPATLGLSGLLVMASFLILNLALAYEALNIASFLASHSRLIAFILSPVLLFQRVTTAPSEQKHIDAAQAALSEVVLKEQAFAKNHSRKLVAVKA